MKRIGLVVLLAVALVLACREGGRGAPARSRLIGGDYGSGGWVVVNPSPVPLDAEIRAVVRRYATSTPIARATMRGALQGTGSFTFRDFARRAAVFAIRERDPRWIADGLAAVAMLHDPAGPGFFDSALAMLDHAARRVGADPAAMFRDAAKMAHPVTANVMRDFPGRDDARKALDARGLHELPTGFIDRNTGAYAPSVDLAHAIIAIAGIVDRDRYHPAHFWIGLNLHPSWMPGAESSLRTVHGTAMVAMWHTDSVLDELQVFVMETADDAAATELVVSSRLVSDHAIVGIARGNLFCVVIDRGRRETRQTLSRWVAPIEAVLDMVRAGRASELVLPSFNGSRSRSANRRFSES
jgi:hypothetical protein